MASVLDVVIAAGTVKAGKLLIRNRRQFDQQLAEFKDGIQLEVTIQRLRATRSVHQNKYWWGVCLHLVSEHTGYSPEEVHEIAKAMFLPKHLSFHDKNGTVVNEFVLGGSTRRLNTKEFSEFVERFKQWAAETLDCYIPDADECEPL